MSSSTRTAVAPVCGFEDREKKSSANKPVRRNDGANDTAVGRIFVAAGAEFITENGDSPGVRLAIRK